MRAGQLTSRLGFRAETQQDEMMMGAVCRLASRVHVSDVVVNLSSRQRVCSSLTRRTVGPTSLFAGVLFFSFFSVRAVFTQQQRKQALLCCRRLSLRLSLCVSLIRLCVVCAARWRRRWRGGLRGNQRRAAREGKTWKHSAARLNFIFRS